jgi:hypothetical protein
MVAREGLEGKGTLNTHRGYVVSNDRRDFGGSPVAHPRVVLA